MIRLYRFYLISTVIILNLLIFVDSACVTAQCRELRRLQQQSRGFNNQRSSGECKSFYLIPGKAIDCSTRSYINRVMNIDPTSVIITPNPVKLPGCFTIQMEVRMLKLPVDFIQSFVSKIEFNWWNLPQFSALPCQNQTDNGCGGYGNNCYYCDVCNNLERLKTDENYQEENNKSKWGHQFNDITCPNQPGVYKFTRQFCFNDFKEFDKDGDCQFDFLQEDGLARQYKDALKNLQQVGYGTVTAKFTLSTNATSEQEKSKNIKELEIERQIERDLSRRRLENGWAVDNQQYVAFRRWFIQSRKDLWHKEEYLPWLLYNNRVGCLSVSFNVCDKEPTPLSTGQTWQCV